MINHFHYLRIFVKLQIKKMIIYKLLSIKVINKYNQQFLYDNHYNMEKMVMNNLVNYVIFLL